MDVLVIGLMVLLYQGDGRTPPVPCVVTAAHVYGGERTYEVTCFHPTYMGQPVVEQWRGLQTMDGRTVTEDTLHLRRVQP